jgi:hypothetical protein
VVDASQFINLQDSINGKYCEKVKKDKKEKTIAPVTSEAPNFKKMTKTMLLDFAAENGIDIPDEANKSSILEIINNSQD